MAVRTAKPAECKEGDILAEHIFNNHGAVLVPENTVLNNYTIFRLKELGIKRVKIYSRHGKRERGNEGVSCQTIKGCYREGILEIKTILNELAAGKPLNVEKIIDITNVVCDDMHYSSDVLKVLEDEKGFDEYTYTHSLNVAFYAMLAGKWLRLESNNIKALVMAGLLHDIGKTRIPIEILNKKSRFSKNEFEIIKKHVSYGYELLKMTGSFTEEVCEAALLHHERMDKSGYPFGLSGEQIGIYARIIAVADVYDAMTSDRVYKKRSTPFEVFEMFKTIGVKNFDPQIANTFLTNLSACYIGTKVLLNTGEIGEVVFIPPQSITEPVISINNEYIDLGREGNKQILCMV